ncbi:MAG TPA: sulfotransferase [Anaerolineales bacterium]|nr:sulfotransferase [Anaerolineales bacterium]
MANHRSDPPILVTGAHRSGTTWVGKMLALSPRIGYISEPLNRWHRPGVMRVPLQHWYTYICEDNEADYFPALQETVQFNYHPWAELRSLRSLKDVLRMGRDGSTFFRGRIFHQRALLKDPFAVFSVPWFAQRLGCQVVIIIRHPAAFVSSLVRLEWPFEISDLLYQPLLMRDWLAPFRARMEEALARPEDIIGRSSLLWTMIYHVVDCFKNRFPGFSIVRHEDLSVDPIEEYRKIFAALGIDFTHAVQEVILNSSSTRNPKEIPRKDIYSVHLDSRANLDNWKNRLDQWEIDRIRELTQEVAGLYYDDSDWE